MYYCLFEVRLMKTFRLCRLRKCAIAVSDCLLAKKNTVQGDRKYLVSGKHRKQLQIEKGSKLCDST